MTAEQPNQFFSHLPEDEASARAYWEGNASSHPDEVPFETSEQPNLSSIDGSHPLDYKKFQTPEERAREQKIESEQKEKIADFAREQYIKIEEILKPFGWIGTNETYISRQESFGIIQGVDLDDTFLNILKTKTADGQVSLFFKYSQKEIPEAAPAEVAETGVKVQSYSYELGNPIVTQSSDGSDFAAARIIRKWTHKQGLWQQESFSPLHKTEPLFGNQNPTSFSNAPTETLSLDKEQLLHDRSPFAFEPTLPLHIDESGQITEQDNEETA